MFKFRKNNKPTCLTIRARDIRVGDQIVYDAANVEVLDVIQNLDNDSRRIRLGSLHPIARIRTRQVDLFNEMLITVSR